MENRILKSQNIVSVIISAYNSEWTIRNTLQALEDQDLSKDLYEVIVVDDGSNTSRTKEIVNEFIGRWIMKIFYFYQKNAWVGIARNLWVSKSTWTILAFTDADCICDNDWLSVIYTKIFVEKMKFIWGITYSNDTVIFPWKMAPVGQYGITANLAIDFTLTSDVLFDSGFTGILGDDTDFVLRMEECGIPLISIPEMRVLHPPNILSFRRILIRSRGRQNEVWLYMKHREKVLKSFSPIFRPSILSRISPFFLLVLIGIFFLIFIGNSFGWNSVILFSLLLFTVFYFYLYRFLVIYNPDNRAIFPKDRILTFFYLIVITPLFLYYRIVWSIKFHFFML